LKLKLTKLNKLIELKMENLKKDGRMIKDFLQSRSTIMKNDE